MRKLNKNMARELKKKREKEREQCAYCEGTGLVYDEVEVNGLVIDSDKPCEECEGTGFRL